VADRAGGIARSNLAHLIIVTTRSARETLWATEQALRSNACGAVLAWPGSVKYTELRRLQIAAEGNCVMAVLFRLPDAARETTCAALRLSLHTWHGHLAVRILKRRGAALAAPILLHSPVVAARRAAKLWPDTHVMDRSGFSLPAARSIPASLDA